MNLIIHRGTHEIGGSCVELATKNTRIIIDVGVPFKLPSGEEILIEDVYKLSPDELIAKGVAKDVPGLYMWDTKNKPPDAILITHPHLDHFGLLPFVNPKIPVYMSSGAQLMIEKVSNLFNRIKQSKQEIRPLTAWQWLTIGDFKIKPFLADHAGFDARGFLIEAEGKKVFYTGDFRGHGKKFISFDKMVENPPKGVDYLITEGTLIEGEETPYKDEAEVENTLIDMMEKTKGIVFISYSAQNIDRVVTIYNAYARAKRIFVIDPYTAHVLNVAKELSKKIPHADFDPCNIFRIFYAKGKYTDILAETELLFGFPKEAKIGYDEIGSNKAKFVVRDTYFIRERFKDKDFLEGAVLIWSQYLGYLSDEIKNFWDKAGVPHPQIHVSGHATPDELTRFINAFDPKHIIPMHTPNPEKFREYFGDKVRVLSDGERIEL